MKSDINNNTALEAEATASAFQRPSFQNCGTRLLDGTLLAPTNLDLTEEGKERLRAITISEGLDTVKNIISYTQAMLREAQKMEHIYSSAAIDGTPIDFKLLEDSYHAAYKRLAAISSGLANCAERFPAKQPVPTEILHYGTEGNSFVLYCQMPPKKRSKGTPDGYAFRQELYRIIPDCAQHRDRFSGKNSLTFVFVYEDTGRGNIQTLDHDNLYVKPLIDSIAQTFSISDSGSRLSTSYLSIISNCFPKGVYCILSPGYDSIQTTASAMDIINRCHWDTN